jgi:nitroreductase
MARRENRRSGLITSLLAKRFSTRRFQVKPVPDDVLAEMLAAGRLSPSGGNEQPWAFGVITDAGLIARIAQIAQQGWIERAPLVIVLCVIPVSDARGGRDIQVRRYPEHARAIVDMDPDLYHALNQEEHQTKIAGTHMALAALEHGVGSCFVSRFDVRRLAELLRLPPDRMPAELLVLGYPERPQKPVRKKALNELVFYDAYPGE